MVLPPSAKLRSCPGLAASYPIRRPRCCSFAASSARMQNQKTAALVAPGGNNVESELCSHHVWRCAGAAVFRSVAGFKFPYALFRRVQRLHAVVLSIRVEQFPRKPPPQSLARPHPPSLISPSFLPSFFLSFFLS